MSLSLYCLHGVARAHILQIPSVPFFAYFRIRFSSLYWMYGRQKMFEVLIFPIEADLFSPDTRNEPSYLLNGSNFKFDRHSNRNKIESCFKVAYRKRYTSFRYASATKDQKTLKPLVSLKNVVRILRCIVLAGYLLPKCAVFLCFKRPT